MSYFADLSTHTYTPTDGLNVVNVGWLDESHPFAKGESSPEFRVALRHLCENPVHLHRGFHVCQFCPPDVQDSQHPIRGNGQIRIQGSGGTWFAAPKMIHHYVVAHNYLPPLAFVQAVLKPAAIAQRVPTVGSDTDPPYAIKPEEQPPATMLDYVRGSRPWRLPPVHWPTATVVALIFASLNWFQIGRPSVPFRGQDEPIDLRGWPWAFEWFGGEGGSHYYDWAALGLNGTLLLLVAFAAGFAVRCIPSRWSRPGRRRGSRDSRMTGQPPGR